MRVTAYRYRSSAVTITRRREMESTDRCIAGIDVHKKMLAVVVRRQHAAQVEYLKKQFGTTRREI